MPFHFTSPHTITTTTFTSILMPFKIPKTKRNKKNKTYNKKKLVKGKKELKLKIKKRGKAMLCYAISNSNQICC